MLLATAPGDGRATLPTPEALAGGQAATALDLLFPPKAAGHRDAYVRRLLRRKNSVLTPPPAIANAQVSASGDWISGADADGKRVARLRIPTLVGGGELDLPLPVANQRHLAKVIPRAQRVIYADASHGFFTQRGRDFLPRLRRFLR